MMVDYSAFTLVVTSFFLAYGRLVVSAYAFLLRSRVSNLSPFQLPFLYTKPHGQLSIFNIDLISQKSVFHLFLSQRVLEIKGYKVDIFVMSKVAAHVSF